MEPFVFGAYRVSVFWFPLSFLPKLFVWLTILILTKQKINRNCNLSGRMVVLDGVRLNQCRRTLDLTASTNFDGRMVAEINLQVLIYNFIEVRQELTDIEEDLKQWHNDWGYLFGKCFLI